MDNNKKIGEDFCKLVNDIAKKFGMLTDKDGRKKKNCVVRDNMADNAQDPYFGLISEEEDYSGPYADFSLVFFPLNKDGKQYVMSLGVGSEGFKNDYMVASQPGWRRLFLKILPKDEAHAPFHKVDFSDIETAVELHEKINIDLKKYIKLLQIGCRVDADEDKALVSAWIAQYAQLRGWATKKESRDAIKDAITKYRGQINVQTNDDKTVVKQLLAERKCVVLQGAPGTGKTYLAEEIGREYDKVFFTQFHAETTYADFIEGIMPQLNAQTVVYERKEGILMMAIQAALEENKPRVLLIIDEINRANLANVLGPTFYLFEPKRTANNQPQWGIKIKKKTIDKLPDNLHVIATMNTADRSIAVVDFALRRRFAWYTVAPKSFKDFKPAAQKAFEDMAYIFERYATDAELNLQPGGAYFVADTEEELKDKLEYELMPLIKEYLDEGLLLSAKTAFANYFYQAIHKLLYQ